jgi:hypothetical protein
VGKGTLKEAKLIEIFRKIFTEIPGIKNVVLLQ